ncbi:MAG: class I SAM-dependent RNA methyltransferase [Clostridia bacterium]|nr:class I SAM-dependent RNA methyltransferase [Clostridia bacterium]
MNHEAFELVATAPFGLEGVVADELRGLSMRNVTAAGGGAQFYGDARDIMRANLWLRCADRVQLIVGRFQAETFEQLYQGIRALPWEKYIPFDARFPVGGNCARSTLMSVRDCQAITKKATADRLLSAHRKKVLPEKAETYSITVALHKDIATLSIDTSGAGLSRRGYRTWNGEAPLRETLAASLLTLSPWRPGQPLHDPLCGTGTLLVEAAFIAGKRAPGLRRAFACESFRWMPKETPAALRREAEAQVSGDAVVRISGADIDAGALTLAKRHLKQAGVRIPLTLTDIRDAAVQSPGGIILTNPPYGERISDRKGCADIARSLRRMQDSSGNTVCVITAFNGFERAFGKRADKRRRLYNGRLECEFLTFYGK